MTIMKITDAQGDKVEFSKGISTGYAYVAVNSGDQVRLLPEQRQEVAEFLQVEKAPAKPDEGVFFLMRQKKSNPAKVKVCFAPDGLEGGVYDSKNKEYHSRERADRACAKQNAKYGDKWNYFVVEKEGK